MKIKIKISEEMLNLRNFGQKFFSLFFSTFMHNKGIENNIHKKYSFGFEALLSTANIRCLVQLTWSVNTDMVLMRQKSTNPFFSLA